MSLTLCSAAAASALIVACLAAFASSARLPFYRSAFVDENSLSPVAKYGAAPSTFKARDWVRIKYSGPRMTRVAPGGRLELECEANGSPPPNVQWFHNDKPVTQSLDENNSIGELRLATVRARLVVDCVTPKHQGTYSCIATAASETAVGASSLVIVQGNNASRLIQCSDSIAPPRIVAWSPTVMETIGNDVVLPCASMGEPRPAVYWVDSQNRLITSGADSQVDDRFKVLDSGDLMISSVRWADMNEYSCIAESPLGRDTTSTFLYPMAKEH